MTVLRVYLWGELRKHCSIDKLAEELLMNTKLENSPMADLTKNMAAKRLSFVLGHEFCWISATKAQEIISMLDVDGAVEDLFAADILMTDRQ